MNSKISLKRILCFLLAAVMAATILGCGKETAKKKKKVVKKKVVVVQTDDVTQENDDNTTIDNNGDNAGDVVTNTGNTTTTLKPRAIPSIKTETEKYQETFTPEFASEYVDWAGADGYTIVYDPGVVENKVLASKLSTFFKDSQNVIVPVQRCTDPSVVNDGKLILVGDTAFKTSNLKETEFAVTLLDNGNLFFEGGHTAMVEKAVDWFRTVEQKTGKVSVLSGVQDDFTSKVSVFGNEYVYVWGDEFDGEEMYDSSKWNQGYRQEYDDLKIVHNDPDFQYVENGRLRISVDRYFDPSDGNIGWGAHGSCQTKNEMLFKNGYLEVKARFDYDQGSFPAIWLMTNDSPLEKYVPDYEQYSGRYFNLETDIFEFFGKGTHATVNMHKWYNTSITEEIKDDNGEGTGIYKKYALNGVDLTDYIKNPKWNNTKNGKNQFNAFVWAYPDNPNTLDFSAKETETLYKDYHIFKMLYTPETVKFGIDDNWYCEWKLDVNFDYKEDTDPTNNNNGIGYNFWHYLLLDQYLYPPSRAEDKGTDTVVTIDSVPLDTYIDYVRLYQLPDDIAIVTSTMINN